MHLLHFARVAPAGPFALSLIGLVASGIGAAGFAVTNVAGATVDRLDEGALDELRVTVKSGDKWVRMRAVEKLAALDELEAWELVVSALADRKGEVADTAQLVIGEMDDAEEIALLAGRDGLKSRDEWVRRRVAEALGRIDAMIDGKLFVRAMDDRDAEVRRAALWSVERRAKREGAADAASVTDRSGVFGRETRASLVKAVARRVARERDDVVRARALCALAALDPDAARDLALRELGAKSAAMRCAATGLVPDLFPRGFDSSRCEELLRRPARDEVRAVRSTAIDALARIETRAAVSVLIDCLELEREERLSVRLVDHLRALSGRKYRRDVRPWRDWVAGLPPDWKPFFRPAAATPERANQSSSVVSFGGMPIVSTRLAFLIDLSGSMWTVRPDGRTRKDVVDEMLREVLERLPPDTKFNVIPFTERPRPWKDELEPAKRKNVRAATDFFIDCNDRGTGNFWDAAMLACRDPEVDTLVVLTDGAPTGGRRHRLELMVPLFEEFDATRRIAVDSILVDASQKLRRYWAELADVTGGRSISIEL